MDDRHINHADDCEHRAGAVRASDVIDRIAQSHVTFTIQEQQQQLRGQPRVPYPIRPHIGRPQSIPVASATAVKEAPIGAQLAATA